MSVKKRSKKAIDLPSDLRITKRTKLRIIGFVIIGIIQVLYFIGSYFLGTIYGGFLDYGNPHYPYSNRKLTSTILMSFGIMNAIYIGLNKRISYQNMKKNIAIKASLSIGSYILSTDFFYWGYNAFKHLWDNVYTVVVLYGVFTRREKA